MILALVAFVLALVGFASPVAATEPQPPPDGSQSGVAPPVDLGVVALPLFGEASLQRGYWTEFHLALSNKGAGPRRGEAVLCGLLGGGSIDDRSCTRAPFEVTPGTTVELRIPVRIDGHGEAVLRLVAEGRTTIFERSFASPYIARAALLEVGGPSALKARLDGVGLGNRYEPWDLRSLGPGTYVRPSPQPTTIAVYGTMRSPESGEALLPKRTASYGSIAAVLVPSDALVRTSAAEASALTGWVLGGGTLAVVVARPEDLRHPTLVALLGGEARAHAVPAEAVADFHEEKTKDPRDATRPIPEGALPRELAEGFVGYAGGNLRPSAFGASASYGLGEVHLLAFDPSHAPAVDSPWIQQRIALLLRRASDRQANVHFRPGEDSPRSPEVRELLDPNESSRWSVATVVILLCGYAILAGPVNFAVWRRRGKPLRALATLLVASAVTFAFVVIFGMLAKGLHSRARRLTIVEAGAGFTHGSARRFRSFFAAREVELSVQPLHASAVLGGHLDAYDDVSDDAFAFDRDALRLAPVNVRPWQVKVVREDGFASLGRGVALVRDGEDTIVVNRTGRALLGLVLAVPGVTTATLPRLADGASARSTEFKQVMLAERTRRFRMDWFDLRPSALPPVLDPSAAGLGEAWIAIDAGLYQPTHWFPEDVPTLLAQVEGGEGVTQDSGMALEQDRMLVRIVGYGGEP